MHMAGGGGDRRGLAVVLGGVVALRKAATRGDAERIAGSMLALPAPWRATSIRLSLFSRKGHTYWNLGIEGSQNFVFLDFTDGSVLIWFSWNEEKWLTSNHVSRDQNDSLRQNTKEIYEGVGGQKLQKRRSKNIYEHLL
ncbi:uncharacterized protein LOC8077951 isoform X2 [Sorghum bicolor]|uniref:uncharacterized protein LOC8077951 isoform X2 n=2 Tax=Sorghum bicolor TaxID=4558 RepID=UPI000B42527C|nr:uncharacterized protein LOC8077951 isoform X2 [Sorghum bicolor]|eukprot:XP_021303019.1 uncharacterized protein LOC8077951 isoform X2 [Sorghum bicolor]